VFTKSSPETVAIYGRQGDSVVGGTGVVIDAQRGLVLTNAHVVSGVAALKARVLDKTEVPARVLATAPCDDLAVVELTQMPPGIQAIELGDSALVKPADEVVALGYPSSFADPATQKVVFTEGRVQSVDVAAEPDPSLPKYPSTIQHSATINHGNSGGPLLNDRGQLVGVNTLGNEGTEEQQVQGQYYAISTNHIKPLLPDLLAGRSQAHPGWDIAAFSQVPLSAWFEGTGYGTAEQGQQADQFLIDNGVDGVFVFGVDAGSSAEEGQLEGGDLVTSINGASVTTAAEVCDILKSAAPGQTLGLEGYYLTSGTGQQFGEAWKTNVILK